MGCALLLTLGACAQHHSGASPSAGGDGDREGDAGAGRPQPALDGALPDTRSTVAFKAGYYEQEQVWLREEHGELRLITPWPAEPSYSVSCTWRTLAAGYSSYGGRFGELVFDAQGRRLLFTERSICGSVGGGRSVTETNQLIAHDLALGTTEWLASTVGTTRLIRAGDATVVSVVRNGGLQREHEITRELSEVEAGALAPIAIPDAGVAYAGVRTFGVRWNGRSVLFVPGIPPLQKHDGEWSRLEVLEPVADLSLNHLDESPSGMRLCGIGDSFGPAARVTDTGLPARIGFVLEPDGRLFVLELGPFMSHPLQRCAISRDERHVAFEHVIAAIGPDGLEPVGPAVEGFTIAGAFQDAFYGTRGEDTVRVDPHSLEVEVVLSSQVSLCGSAGRDDLNGPRLVLAPDARGIAVLQQPCAAGGGPAGLPTFASVVLQLEHSRSAVLEEPWGAHEAYDLAWPVREGVLLFSVQARNHSVLDALQRTPGPGRYIAVDRDMQVQTVDLSGAIPDVLHGPAIPPAPR